MKLLLALIVSVILTINTFSSQADDIRADELTLRNQLFADVFLLKEGVDRLQISVEVLNKRYNNQMEILKSLQSKFLSGSDSEEVEGCSSACERITGMLNVTSRKYNAFESRIVTKLEEIQDDQTTRLGEILAKQKLNRNCAAIGDPSAAVAVMADTLTEMSEKLNNFENKFVKFEAWEVKLNLRQNKFEKLVEAQTKILQEISDKVSHNQVQFDKFGQDLASLKDLKDKVSQVITNTRPKLPMEVILGLSSANITSLKSTNL